MIESIDFFEDVTRNPGVTIRNQRVRDPEFDYALDSFTQGDILFLGVLVKDFQGNIAAGIFL